MDEKNAMRRVIAICSDADGRKENGLDEVPTLEEIVAVFGGGENVYNA